MFDIRAVFEKKKEKEEKGDASLFYKDLVGLRHLIEHATNNEEFRRYCEEVAARNKTKLKLPGSGG